MCFGPVASFTASGILATLGTAVLRNIRSRKEIFFAAFPVLFALQQAVEGALWLAMRGAGPPALLHALTFAFLFFAYGLWPALCPLSVYAIEYDPRRQKILRVFIFLGAAASLYLLFSILQKPVRPVMSDRNIRYETDVAGAPLFTAVYLAATILPYWISSQRAILVFGIPNLLFFAVSYFFYRRAFISVWCFFAAVLSLTLYVFLKKLHHEPIVPSERDPA